MGKFVEGTVVGKRCWAERLYPLRVAAAFPIEELLFGIGIVVYWSGVYGHLAWHRST